MKLSRVIDVRVPACQETLSTGELETELEKNKIKVGSLKTIVSTPAYTHRTGNDYEIAGSSKQYVEIYRTTKGEMSLEIKGSIGTLELIMLNDSQEMLASLGGLGINNPKNSTTTITHTGEKADLVPIIQKLLPYLNAN